jgi:hypothetical protein
MAQAVACLLSKHKALNSNASNGKKYMYIKEEEALHYQI